MKISRYIASRLSGNKDNASNYSRLVVVTGVISIVLSLSIMIIATSVVTGFKNSVTVKVAGIASHITITNLDNNTSFETQPLVKDKKLMKKILAVDHIRHIQPYALKHGIIKTKKEIQGIIIKGVDASFDWNSFAPTLVEGERINPADTLSQNDVMVSKALANALGLKTGDTLYTYYLSKPTRILSEKVMREQAATVFYSLFPSEYIETGPEMIYNTSNKEVAAYVEKVSRDSVSSLAPRAVKLKLKGVFETGIYELDKQLVIGSLSLVQDMYGWTGNNISGYEIYIDNYEKSTGVQTLRDLYKTITFQENKDNLTKAYDAVAFLTPAELYPSDIRSNYPEIFEWLPAIDINGIIIMVLMVMVSVMAMLSTLLILIMEKTEMIGVLKTLGMNNWQVRKVFLWHAAYIILQGMIIGNIIGIGLVLIQYLWHPLKMDQDSYYLPFVPVDVDWVRYIFINIATFLVCVFALVLPSIVVSRISPVKAIRMD